MKPISPEFWSKKLAEIVLGPTPMEMLKDHPAEFLAANLPPGMGVEENLRTGKLRIVKGCGRVRG